MSEQTVSQSFICSSDDLGGMTYPFLRQYDQWVIRTRPLAADIDAEPTLRWVKDNKVLDLFIPGVDHALFRVQNGLRLNMERGAFVLSKRLSRIMRPYRYWRFFNEQDIQIEFAPLDGKLWDGCALISRHLLERLSHNLTVQTDEEFHLYRRELERVKRVEITVLHSGGQEKGHAFVVEDMAVDLVLPIGATKGEVQLVDGRVFVGIQPVHCEDQMRLDIQSLVNLHPFFQPDHLLDWLEKESDLFLHRIRSGQIDAIVGRLVNLHSAQQVARLRQWVIGDYLSSGGSLLWFPGAVRAMTRQFLRRLQHNQDRFRFPIPGGYYHIFPAVVGGVMGGQPVEPGHVLLDDDAATAWVADQDWLDFIVPVLGGCDGDDAVWVFPFTDFDGERKILLWRSPNQLGEYVILRPAPGSHEIRWETAVSDTPITWPEMDSRDLPPRIDTVAYTFGALQPFARETPGYYSIEAMSPAIADALQNQHVLGAYCNALLVIKASYGRLSKTNHLPARLEDVIDGSVKSPLDLSPVMEWIQMVGKAIERRGTAVPTCLHERLPQVKLRPGGNHWLDVLMGSVERHLYTYEAAAAQLESEAAPPLALFQHGLHWREAGAKLCQVYQQAARQYAGDFDRIQQTVINRMKVDLPGLLSGAAAHIYTHGLSDAVLWQLDFADGRAGVARAWLEELRRMGLIGEAIWTKEGTVRFYSETVETGVPVQLNGVWFNISDSDHTSMSQVTPPEAREMKTACAQQRFINRVLLTDILDDDRLIVRTPDGRLFGYVQRGQELRLLKKNRWVIRWTAVRDGNVYAVVS